MIKFFRKIRKRLLPENKVGKYLIYAIGEIVLVVIGILIAINLNNKNNNHKEKELVIQKLEKLRYEVYQDSINTSSIINYYSENIYYSNKIIGYLENNDTSISCDSVIILLSSIESPKNVLSNKSTYDEMVYTGLFAKIDNNDLKLKIENYYKLHENFSDVIWQYVKELRDLRNDLIKNQYIDLKYHLPDQDLASQEICEYSKQLVKDQSKRKAIKNYVYKILETQQRIQGFYSILNQRVLAGIPIKENMSN